MARWDFVGFTMYLHEAEDGAWLTSVDALAFFELATASRLAVSLSAMPHQLPAVTRLAAAFPSLPILLHHFAFLGPRSAATTNGMELVLAAAAHRNISVKYSGMGNVAAPEQDYPYPELAGIPPQLHRTFGPNRLVWGSDYPVSRKHMTYAQTMRLAERHGPLGAAELAPVMGGNIARLLEERVIAT
jgi:predicted TIM-barrel fold metal-dependent hydrolase